MYMYTWSKWHRFLHTQWSKGSYYWWRIHQKKWCYFTTQIITLYRKQADDRLHLTNGSMENSTYCGLISETIGDKMLDITRHRVINVHGHTKYSPLAVICALFFHSWGGCYLWLSMQTRIFLQRLCIKMPKARTSNQSRLRNALLQLHAMLKI